MGASFNPYKDLFGLLGIGNHQATMKYNVPLPRTGNEVAGSIPAIVPEWVSLK